MNYKQWRRAIKQIRLDLTSWRIPTDHLSDHELETAIRSVADIIARQLTIGEAIDGLHNAIKEHSPTPSTPQSSA